MSTEKEKMLAGELYDPLDPDLRRERQRCRDLCERLNDSHEDQQEERKQVLAQLFGIETDAWVQPPFFCDYGVNIRLGSKVFFNFNCVVLDVMQALSGAMYCLVHPFRSIPPRIQLMLKPGASGLNSRSQSRLGPLFGSEAV